MNPRRSVIWLALALLAILAAVCALAGVSQIGNLMSAGSNDYAGPPAPLALVIAAVCFFCFGLSVYAVIQVEHKLHRRGWDYDFRAPVGGNPAANFAHADQDKLRLARAAGQGPQPAR
jgi:hypothetical protein